MSIFSLVVVVMAVSYARVGFCLDLEEGIGTFNARIAEAVFSRLLLVSQ